MYVDFLQNLIGSAFITPTINPKIATTIGMTQDACYLEMNKNSEGMKYDTMITNNAYLIIKFKDYILTTPKLHKQSVQLFIPRWITENEIKRKATPLINKSHQYDIESVPFTSSKQRTSTYTISITINELPLT